MALSLSGKLLIRCRSTLIRCPEFDSDQSLSAVFIVDVLAPFRFSLPETNSPIKRVDNCIRHLLDNQPSDSEILLVYFLEQLAERQMEGDALRDTLSDLARAVELELLAAAASQRANTRDEQVFALARANFSVGEDQPPPAAQERKLASEWLAEAQQDTDEWAFRIALAIFNGMPDNQCAAATHDLAERLRPLASPASDAPPKAPAIPRPRRPRLKAAGADLELVSIGDGADARSLWVVQLDDAALPAAALECLWMDYDEWRQPLAEWLTKQAAEGTADVRTRAAVTVGALACIDFNNVRDRLIGPWAHQPNSNLRAAIGKALGAAVLDAQRKSEVCALLRAWARTGGRNLRWAATRAYIYVGLHVPEEAFAQWRAIAAAELANAEREPLEPSAQGWNGLLSSLRHAMFTLFSLVLAQPPDQQRRVFEAGLCDLQAWDKAGAGGLAEMGMQMFLQLARVRQLADAQPEAVGGPPILLALIDPADPASPYRAALAGLFYRALRQPHTMADSLEALREWIGYVESDLRYRPQLLVLLRDIVKIEGRRGRIWDRLRVRLREWAARPAPSSVAWQAYQQLGDFRPSV